MAEKKSYPVYIVFSSAPLYDIAKELHEPEFLKNIRQQGMATNRSLALLDSERYAKAEADFKADKTTCLDSVRPYTPAAKHLPQNNQTFDIYIPLPPLPEQEGPNGEHVYAPFGVYRKLLMQHFPLFVKYGLCEEKKFSLHVPQDPNTGRARGQCYIKFYDHPNPTGIVLIKALLLDMPWDDERFGHMRIRCFWANKTEKQTRPQPPVTGVLTRLKK